MWKPPGALKHPLPEEASVTAETVRASRLFSPLRLACGVTLAHRGWVPAMVPWRASPEGFVTPAVLEWYGRFADGRPGALVVEATGIRDVPSGPLLRASDDRFVPGLRSLVETVRARSGGATRVFVQLIDFLNIRRRPVRERFLREFLVLDAALRDRLAAHEATHSLAALDDAALRAALCALDDAALRVALCPRDWEALQYGARERVTDTHLPHIRDLPRVLPERFAAAARRAEAAGFDGVELHYAHAYTMSSFLSALNTRSDGYGGDRAGRLRLPLEVYAAVRDAVAPGFAVGCRFLCDDIVPGGSRVDDACHFGVAFARAGMDFLSLSTGGRFEDAAQPRVGEAAYPYTGPSGFACMPTVHADARGPFGRNLPAQGQVRAAVRAAGYDTPVVVAGGIATFAQAEAALCEGVGDLIGAARQSLADPDWWEKLRLGRADEVRRCKFTNYCEALDQRHQVVTCQRWDRLGLDDPAVPRTADGRRRLTAPPWSPSPRDSTD
jgi:2,4-dienoyl-CoA reductase-like NADH-dependent reductase (Old Yellow Enzyme family)